MGEGTRPIADRMMACFRMADLHPREQIILAIIAFHDGPGGAWPSLAKLAGEAKIARSTVADVVKSLKRKGRILVTRGRSTNRYRVAYFEPFTVRENQTVRNVSDCQGDPNRQCQGVPDTNLELTGGPQGKSMQRLDAQRTDTPPTHHQLRYQERQMDRPRFMGLIGFCRDCGYGFPAGAPGCPTCGSEEGPFICTEAELKSGIIALPFGLSASGLDTPEGRLLFLSEAGQAGLRDAYAVIFGDRQPEGMRQ